MASSASGRPMWSRVHAGAAGPRAPVRAVVLTAILAGVVALLPVTLSAFSGTRVGLVGAGGASRPPSEPAHGPPDGIAVEDPRFASPPAQRSGLAFLTLDDRLERAVSTLGPPDHRVPDMNATTAHTWELAPGAEFDVIADDRGITGLAARVPADPPVRIAAHAGIIIGQSTPADITDRWGTGHATPRHPGEDFVLRYIECAGPLPVVIKFHQDTAAPEVHWNEPVTGVLIAYADAEPGTAGCGP